MNFNFTQFCDDYSIQYVEDGHKHCREGWVQIVCPFCIGNPGYHLGFNIDNDFFSCWRCGYHTINSVLIALTGENKYQLYRYFTKQRRRTTRKRCCVENAKYCELPKGTKELQSQHVDYLHSRGFTDFERLKPWKLQGTSFLGDHKFRIIIPIYYKNELVSYQGRDITNTSQIKYKTCSKINEVVFHKHVLFGYDYAVKNDSVVVCEGVFDVMRLGKGAVATFGINYSHEQVRLLSKFKKIFVLFDSHEKQASKQALKLAKVCSCLGCYTEIITLDNKGDPADLKQSDADKIMYDLLRIQ